MIKEKGQTKRSGCQFFQKKKRIFLSVLLLNGEMI